MLGLLGKKVLETLMICEYLHTLPEKIVSSHLKGEDDRR